MGATLVGHEMLVHTGIWSLSIDEDACVFPAGKVMAATGAGIALASWKHTMFLSMSGIVRWEILGLFFT